MKLSVDFFPSLHGFELIFYLLLFSLYLFVCIRLNFVSRSANFGFSHPSLYVHRVDRILSPPTVIFYSISHFFQFRCTCFISFLATFSINFSFSYLKFLISTPFCINSLVFSPFPLYASSMNNTHQTIINKHSLYFIPFLVLCRIHLIFIFQCF